MVFLQVRGCRPSHLSVAGLVGRQGDDCSLGCAGVVFPQLPSGCSSRGTGRDVGTQAFPSGLQAPGACARNGFIAWDFLQASPVLCRTGPNLSLQSKTPKKVMLAPGVRQQAPHGDQGHVREHRLPRWKQGPSGGHRSIPQEHRPINLLGVHRPINLPGVRVQLRWPSTVGAIRQARPTDHRRREKTRGR